MNRMGLKASDLDKRLGALNPQFVVRAKEGESIYLGMSAGAGGGMDSPGMQALNDIQSVSFVMFD